jgi:predicted component of type VI protein secretion system
VPVTIVVRRLGSGAAPADPSDLARLTFDAPRIVLGRSASCDVRLPDASVSGRHASIRAGSGGYVIVDEGSTNGTKLNGQKLSAQAPRKLESGDVVTLGRVELTVKLGAAKTSSPADTRELALAMVQRMLGEARTESAPTIVVEAGPDAGATLALDTAGARTIGRDPRCALKLTDKSLPPIALEVQLEGTKVRVVPRDPRARAKIGERGLDAPEPVPWPDGALLTIGATTLRLDDPIARALEASASLVDEKVEALPPPPEPAPEPIAAPVADEVEAAPPAPAAGDEKPAIEPTSREPRGADRRRSWRGATLAFELIALILGLLVLGASATGLWWLLHK